jgi:hypothetical protein
MAQKPFFVIPTPLGTVTSGNERVNRPASHLGQFYYKGMVWQSTGNASLYVRCDLGSAQEIDFVGVLAANALSTTTIRVRLGDSQAEVDGSADYDSTALPFIDPLITRDDGLYHSHLELPSVQTKQWVRIDIGGHTGDFSASMLVIGKKIQPVEYYEPKWNRDIRDLGSLTFARNGVPGISYGERLRAIGFTLAWLNEEEMEELFSPMDEAVGKTDPLFVCFDPEATDYRQRRTFFGFNEEQPSYTKQGFNRFQRSFQFLSLF